MLPYHRHKHSKRRVYKQKGGVDFNADTAAGKLLQFFKDEMENSGLLSDDVLSNINIDDPRTIILSRQMLLSAIRHLKQENLDEVVDYPNEDLALGLFVDLVDDMEAVLTDDEVDPIYTALREEDPEAIEAAVNILSFASRLLYSLDLNILTKALKNPDLEMDLTF